MDLIIYPNPRIDKPLLLASIRQYNEKCHKTVNMRILNTELTDNGKDYYLDGKEYLKIYLEVRQANFYCRAYAMTNGEIDKTKTRSVPASWETIPICYKLDSDKQGQYRVESNDELFYLLNYALQKRGKIMEGNRQGFKNMSYNEISNPLNHLNFKAMVKEIDGQNMLMPIEMEEIPILKE